MDLFDVIKARKSVRAYQSQEVEPEKLNTILATVLQAPSAGNLQAFKVHVVRDAKRKLALAAAALNQEFLAQAPVVLVFCADRERSGSRYHQRGEQLYSLQDATIAVTYAQLAATALGLATCWVGAFDENQVGRIMEVPPGQHPVAMLPIGHGAEVPSPTGRRSLTELVVDPQT